MDSSLIPTQPNSNGKMSNMFICPKYSSLLLSLIILIAGALSSSCSGGSGGGGSKSNSKKMSTTNTSTSTNTNISTDSDTSTDTDTNTNTDTNTSTATNTDTNTCTTHSETININIRDDGEMWGDNLELDGEEHEGNQHICVGAWGPVLVWGYWRFKLPETIVNGAIITNAYMTLSSIKDENWISEDYGLDIWAVNQANPSLPTQYTDHPKGPDNIEGSNEFQGTTAKVNWKPGVWSSAVLNTPNLKTVIQELVNNHNGLASNNHILFYSTIDANTYNDLETEICFLHSTSSIDSPPKLTLEWNTCQE